MYCNLNSAKGHGLPLHVTTILAQGKSAPAALCFGVLPLSNITLLLMNISNFVALHGEHEPQGPLFITGSSGKLLHVVLVLSFFEGLNMTLWWLDTGRYIITYYYSHFETISPLSPHNHQF